MERQTKALSDDLNPTEIKTKEFGRTLLGYSPKEVVGFLDATAKAWERVQKNERALLQMIENLKMELSEWKSKEAELDRLRSQAVADADSIRSQAKRDAERTLEEVRGRILGIRDRTESWLERVISSLENVEREREKFQVSIKSVLDQHYSLLKSSEYTVPLSRQLTEVLGEIGAGDAAQ